MKTISQQRGQGLIEILIAVVIIVGSVVAIMRFQSNLAYSNSISQQQSDATLLAMSRMESLRDFNVLTNQSPYTSYQGIISGSSTTTGTNATYTVTWTITTNTNPNYKVISIVVSWTDRYGAAQSIRLVSQVAGTDPAYSATVMG